MRLKSLYRLELLLVLASAVILKSDSCGTHDHIFLSHIRDFPTWRARSSYLYPSGTGWPGSRSWAEGCPLHITRGRTTEKTPPPNFLCCQPALSVSHCVCPLSLLGNGSVNTFPRNEYTRILLYAIRVVWNESQFLASYGFDIILRINNDYLPVIDLSLQLRNAKFYVR
jgi:hypothetical protein